MQIYMQAFDNSIKGRESAYMMGKWLQAQLLGDVRAVEWCQARGINVNPQNALTAGNNALGGVLVPEEWSSTIIRLVETYGVFRRNTRVVPMSTDSMHIPRRTGGLTAYYVGENTAGTESDMSWDDVQLSVKKLMILTRMSSEINDDALIVLADMLAQEMAYAFALKEDTVGFTGTGASTDGGITGILVKCIDGSHGKAKVAAASGHDTLAEIDSTDLINLMAAIPLYAKPSSAWYCSPTAEELIFNAIKVSGGGNTGSILAARQSPGFLGYPINVTPIMADDSTATYNGDVVVAFGNLSLASTLGSRRDVRIQLSTEQYWEEDQIGVKGTMRHDINIHDVGSDAVRSPFAVLTGQS